MEVLLGLSYKIVKYRLIEIHNYPPTRFTLVRGEAPTQYKTL